VGLFGANRQEVSQESLVASCLTNILQITNQVYTQGHATEIQVGMLGPIIVSASQRVLKDRTNTELLLKTFELQRVESPSLAPLMENWISYSVQISQSYSAQRAEDLKGIITELFNVQSNVISPLVQKSASADSIMDRAHQEAVRIFSEYFTKIDLQYPGNIEFFAVIVQILSSSFVLFTSDLMKARVSSQNILDWNGAMLGMLAGVCALTGQMMDEM